MWTALLALHGVKLVDVIVRVVVLGENVVPELRGVGALRVREKSEILFDLVRHEIVSRFGGERRERPPPLSMRCSGAVGRGRCRTVVSGD
eukprot:1251450-Pleurochrysis_carterae.AAC.1